MLDSVESFDLEGSLSGSGNFKVWDKEGIEEELYRLPWPMMDMTTVKIPVSWMPKKCIRQYQRKKNEHLKGEGLNTKNEPKVTPGP